MIPTPLIWISIFLCNWVHRLYIHFSATPSFLVVHVTFLLTGFCAYVHTSDFNFVWKWWRYQPTQSSVHITQCHRLDYSTIPYSNYDGIISFCLLFKRFLPSMTTSKALAQLAFILIELHVLVFAAWGSLTSQGKGGLVNIVQHFCTSQEFQQHNLIGWCGNYLTYTGLPNT